MSASHRSIRRAEIRGDDATRAAEELHAKLTGEALALVVVFASADADWSALGPALAARFGSTPVIGCTTAGEISAQGATEGGIVAFSLPASLFHVAVARFGALRDFSLAEGARVVEGLRDDLRRQGFAPAHDTAFAMLLVDGLAQREEIVASALDAALGGVPLFGGSAGDGTRFQRTAVLADGRFEPDSGVVALVHSRLPFRVFKSQHAEITPRKFVVTAADRGSRRVMELDGEPAALRYARAVGVPPDQLGPETFAAFPVVVRLGGMSYVRSIAQRHEDDSLSLLCAIEEGLVLTLARSGDQVDSLRATFEEIRNEIGPPELIIGCDCILRRIEAERPEQRARLDALFAEFRVIGLGTYGEQFRGVHVNQTFTGVALGATPREAA